MRTALPAAYILRSNSTFLGVILVMIFLGLLTQYSIDWHLALKQGIWAVVGVALFWICLMVPYKTFLQKSPYIYTVLLVLLVLVRVVGHESHGARRWLGVGSIMIQPSEFMKLALLFLLIYLFGREPSLEGLRVDRILLAFFLTLIPAYLISKQPDLGTALGLIFTLAIFFVLRGIRAHTFFLTILASVTALPIAWQLIWTHLHSFQKDRIRTFLNPEADPMGLGYHTLQSMVAVGSGGLWGQGIHGATQVKFRYLPGASTDFAFAVFSEEWGFLGALLLIILNILIIWFGFETAMTASDPKGFYLAAGLTGVFGISFLINAGMVVGILPVVGIPMPFMSYGGSALLMTMVGLALILNVRLRDCG